MKRFVSLMLVLALCLSCSMSVFATGPRMGSQEDREKELLLSEASEIKEIELSDGTILTFAVLPAGPQPRGGYDLSGTARPSYTSTYTLKPQDGNFCRSCVYNVDKEDGDMRVTLKYTATNGEDASGSDVITLGNRYMLLAQSENGDGLTGQVTVTIKATNGASRVDFTYSVDQHWIKVTP